jgi:hypothetical protein
MSRKPQSETNHPKSVIEKKNHEEDLQSLDTSKLKDLLAKKGLSTIGDREVMIARLQRRLVIDSSILKLESSQQKHPKEEDDVPVEFTLEFTDAEEEVDEETANEEDEEPGRWIVIHATLPYTIAVGVYSTKTRAQIAYITFLRFHDLDLLTRALERISETHLEADLWVDDEDWETTDLAHLAQQIYHQDPEIMDTFMNTIPHDINNLPEGEEFDFRTYIDWDQLSLDTLLDHLKNGTFDDVKEEEEVIGDEDSEEDNADEISEEDEGHEDNEAKARRVEREINMASRTKLFEGEGSGATVDPDFAELDARLETSLDDLVSHNDADTGEESSSKSFAGDSVPYPKVSKEELDRELDRYMSKRYKVDIPESIYDSEMFLVDFLTSLKLSTKNINYDSKRVSFWLPLPSMEFVDLDARLSKRYEIPVNGDALEFRYYHKFPVGNTWVVTASR